VTSLRADCLSAFFTFPTFQDWTLSNQLNAPL
jgi:hypothetical protein